MKRSIPRTIGLFAAVLLMFFNKFLPAIEGLNPQANCVLWIFVGTIYLLIVEDVMWPLFLAILAFATNDVYSVTQSLKLSIGSDLFMFIVANTMVLAALRRTGVFQRFAFFMLSIKFARNNSWIFIIVLLITEFIVGFFITASVTFLIFLSITEDIFKEVGIDKKNKNGRYIIFAELLVVSLAFGVSPIGHPPSMLSIEIFSNINKITYVDYICVGMTPFIICFTILLLSLKFVFKLDLSNFHNFVIKHQKKPFSKEEKFALAVFVCMVIWWFIPGFLENTFVEHLDYLFPVLAGVLLYTLVPINGKPLINIIYSLKHDAAWRPAFAIGSSVLLGSALSDKQFGIAQFFTNLLSPIVDGLPPIIFILVLCLFCTIFTNFCSDTVSAMIICTIASTVIIQQFSPLIMSVCLGNCVAYSFATPPGSPYSAIASGSGWFTSKFQFVVGFSFSLTFSLIFAFCGYGFSFIF